jgi:hypothetical protein
MSCHITVIAQICHSIAPQVEEEEEEEEEEG